MTRSTQGAVLAVVGVVVLGTVAGERYLTMVRPAMRWPLVLASLVLLATAANLLLRRSSQGACEAGEAVHDHGASRVGLLLAVPFLVMAVVPVAPLSTWTAQRTEGVERGARPAYAAVPPGDVVPVRTSEFVERAVYDEQASLRGRRVRLTGFVSPEGQGWAVTRMVMICCAADAYAAKVVVDGAASPAQGTWVEVTGMWVPTAPYDGKGAAPWPRLRVESVRQVAAPTDPYE